MGNLYVLRKSATASVLIDVWMDDLKDDIARMEKVFSEEEHKWKEPFYTTFNEMIEHEEHEKRIGCLLTLLQLPISYFTQLIPFRPAGPLVGESAQVKEARKFCAILENNDFKTAVQLLKENYQLPNDFSKEADKLVWQFDIIHYLKDVASVVEQAQNMLRDHPEKSDAFADTYFHLQSKDNKADSLFINLLTAIQSLNIEIGDLITRAEPFISKGGYLDFSIQPYINEWMNTYERTHS